AARRGGSARRVAGRPARRAVGPGPAPPLPRRPVSPSCRQPRARRPWPPRPCRRARPPRAAIPLPCAWLPPLRRAAWPLRWRVSWLPLPRPGGALGLLAAAVGFVLRLAAARLEVRLGGVLHRADARGALLGGQLARHQHAARRLGRRRLDRRLRPRRRRLRLGPAWLGCGAGHEDPLF